MMGITATVFFMLLCQFGSSIQTCRECQCCNYEQQFCDSSKNCTGDCIAGYYGENCTEECLENCLTCVNGTECNECKPGYYTAMCNKACGKGCDNNTCSISSEECSCKSANFINGTCQNCSGNKYGDECNKTCPGNCITCISDTECTLCLNSMFYGSRCQYSCSMGCTKGTCNKDDGHCTDGCKSGFSTDKCDPCLPGLYGKDCKLNCGKGCVNNTCLLSSGECVCKSTNFIVTKCDACSDNKYGDECNKACPSNCGSCIAETKCSWCKNIVYYGSYCQYRCSVGCFNGRCGKGNGHCTGGCKPGFVGKKCDMCSPGFYGTYCDLNCTDTCSKCLFANVCTECKLGFYGETCTSICPTGWDGNNQICDLQTGHCLEGCKMNYFGSLCNNKCPDNCQSNDSKHICDDMNGYCTFGCKDGFRGEKCDKKCSSHCENATCNQVTDECLYGCTGGFEGLKCIQATKSAVSEQKKPLVIIASSAGVGVAAIVLLVILVICLKTESKTKYIRSYKMRGKRLRTLYERDSETN